MKKLPGTQRTLEDFSKTVIKIEEKGRFSLELPKQLFPHYKKLSNRIIVEFYPYKLLRSTIREKNGSYIIRLSDMLQDAPDEINNTLCWILLLRILGKKVPADLTRIWRKYSHSDKMDKRIRERRLAKGTKRMSSPQGETYDLEKIFSKLNNEFFNTTLTKPKLGFSLRRTRTRWGHYDPDLGSITISRTLDAKEIPSHVIEYVMFHEMLHIVYDIKKKKGRRSCHYKEFREAEKQYPKYRQAHEWLRKLAGALRKRRGKKD